MVWDPVQGDCVMTSPCSSWRFVNIFPDVLTLWGRMTHICVGKLSIIGSDNGLSPGRRQAIIRNNAGILLIGPLGMNFSEILIGIQTFSIKEMHLKMSSAKWRPFCLGLDVLTTVANRRKVEWRSLSISGKWLNTHTASMRKLPSRDLNVGNVHVSQRQIWGK